MTYRADEFLKGELIWIYNYADADCGLKSNWNSMVQASMCPGSAYVDPYDSFILRAVEKRRDIEKVLWQLPKAHQDCLFSLYGPVHIPHSIVSVMGDLAGPSLCTQALSLKNLEKLCDRQLLGKATPKDRLTISEIRIEALDITGKSINSYKRKRNEKTQKE